MKGEITMLPPKPASLKAAKQHLPGKPAMMRQAMAESRHVGGPEKNLPPSLNRGSKTISMYDTTGVSGMGGKRR